VGVRQSGTIEYSRVNSGRSTASAPSGTAERSARRHVGCTPWERPPSASATSDIKVTPGCATTETGTDSSGPRHNSENRAMNTPPLTYHHPLGRTGLSKGFEQPG